MSFSFLLTKNIFDLYCESLMLLLLLLLLLLLSSPISIPKICIDWDFLLKTKLNGSPMCCVCVLLVSELFTKAESTRLLLSDLFLKRKLM